MMPLSNHRLSYFQSILVKITFLTQSVLLSKYSIRNSWTPPTLFLITKDMFVKGEPELTDPFNLLIIVKLKGPTHDSDFQPQPQFPTATSTKFPVYGLQQPQLPPQLAGRGCCWSEFSDIWWAELKVAVEVAVVYGQKRSNMSHKRRYLHAFELVHWYKWNFPRQTGSEIIFTMQFGYWL